MGVWGEFEDCHSACQCLVVIFELMGNRLWFCMSFYECLSEQQSNILLAITCLQVRGLNCLCDLPTPNVARIYKQWVLFWHDYIDLQEKAYAPCG